MAKFEDVHGSEEIYLLLYFIQNSKNFLPLTKYKISSILIVSFCENFRYDIAFLAVFSNSVT